MADTAVHSFTAKTTPVATDEFYLVQSPFGSGDDRRITHSNLFQIPSATPIAFNADTGLSRVSAGVVGVGTGAAGAVDGTIQALTHAALSNSGTFTLGASSDVILTRDAANTLALRNGANAQTFNVYKSYTDASNYAAFAFQANGNGQFYISITKAGSGSIDNDLNLYHAGFAGINFFTQASQRWSINSSGHFMPNGDNTYDIGDATHTVKTLFTTALRVNQTPTAVSQAVDTTINSGADGAGNIGHRFSINLNGTTYWIPCSTTAF